jgi:hypothetical protein
MRNTGQGIRFQIGEYYLDCPHPERGGFFYACRYDDRTRTTRRRSLGTRDEEAAKIALAALVAAAPQGPGAGVPDAGQVLTVAAFKAYMDDRGSAIASEELADRAVTLFTDYLTSIRQIEAPVSFWTSAQQLACARWLNATHGHSAGYIERLFNVMRSAFVDAAVVKMRCDAVGNQVEAALLTTPPKIAMRRELIASELKIAPRRPRRKTLSLDEMARVLEEATTPHLFRFAILSLCTWARPQAVIDFDPITQSDWQTPAIDLKPVGWRPTKKRRATQPMSQCLADWLVTWLQEDDQRSKTDIAAGRAPLPEALLVYKRQRVATTKQAWRRIGRDLDLADFSQKQFRHFMADQVRLLFRGIPREQRSRWLGHVVRDGSETTAHYEGDDPLALIDVALAVDCVMALLAERCSRRLLAIETRLNRDQLAAIGARQMPKNVGTSRPNGGRDRDRTCDPYRVEVVLYR